MIKYMLSLFLVLIMIALGNASSIELTSKPEYHEVTYQGLTVRYRAESCGSLSGNVLLNIAHDSEVGAFDWMEMKKPEYRRRTLYNECKRLRKEIASRSFKEIILNK